MLVAESMRKLKPLKFLPKADGPLATLVPRPQPLSPILL